MPVAGKVAVVTGGGMGIGEFTAKAFAEEGADTVIGDINLESAQKVIKDIEKRGEAGGGGDLGPLFEKTGQI